MEGIELAGLTLEYEAAGSGPPLLYLGPEHYGRWQARFVDRLSARWSVLAPRHPGFDGRPPPADFRTVDDLAYLYLDLLDALDLGDVLVLGSSIGGWIGIEMAVRERRRLRGLAAIAPLGVKLSGREARDYADLFAMPEAEVRARLFADPDRFAPSFETLDADDMEGIARERQYLAYYAWRPYLHNPSLDRWLHRLDMPVHLVWGERDGYVEPGLGRALAARLAHATFALVPGTGHYPQLERPDAVLETLASFADTLPPTRTPRRIGP